MAGTCLGEHSKFGEHSKLGESNTKLWGLQKECG